MPECLNFLNRALVLLAPKEIFSDNEIPGYFPTPEESVGLSIKNTQGKDIEAISAVKLEDLSIENEESNEEFKLSLLQGSLRMIEKYLQLYAATPALLEVFQDTLTIVSQLTHIEWHQDIKVRQKKK
jgi:nucleolar protein 14